MTNPKKDQIAAELEKIKALGGSRAERIRKIFQDAFSQTVTELKAGANEIGSVAKESTSTVISTLKEKRQAENETMQPAAAPVEVKIDDDDENLVATPEANATDVVVEVQPSINQASPILESPVEPLAVEPMGTTPVSFEQSVEPVIEPVVEPVAEPVAEPIVEIIEPAAQTSEAPIVPTAVADEETSQSQVGSFADSLKTLAERLLRTIQESETYASVSASVKQKLAMLDAKLTGRYGVRYETFKQEFQQDMAKAKVWYENTKANDAERGTSWVEQKQSELQTKMSETGATIAQKEQKIKQLLKEVWQTARN
ncbi:MAG: hypothetical protein EDM05_031170 [Leptolyngbya sp. IPPAS B-1204]|nr:hypothetical protein [Elainella sp. C42_A2020_010]RNJ67413.1 MAG: hypothetical protein EDM05_20900 [Leptolyngbya sp. IPPAS B-1204]